MSAASSKAAQGAGDARLAVGVNSLVTVDQALPSWNGRYLVNGRLDSGKLLVVFLAKEG